MRTPLSIQDLAVLTSALQEPLQKSTLVSRALGLVRSATFDDAVAFATVDRLVGLGALRKNGVRYEITREGQLAAGRALQDHRQLLARMGQLGSPRLVENPDRKRHDTLASG